MTQSVEFDVSSPIFRANPYPDYALAREYDPIHWIILPGQQGAWLVTRYEDAEAILRDTRFVKKNTSPERQLAQTVPGIDISVIQQLSSYMLNTDPPDHTRLRSLVNRAFTPHLIEQWRGRIQEITDQLLDAVQDKGEMELLTDFAFPLPITIISEMLGIPPEDRSQFRAWSNALLSSLGNPQSFVNAFSIMEAFVSYLHNLITRRREQPTGDLVSKLVEAEAESDRLSERELVAMIFLLLVAGHETTVNLIGNGVLALLLHPEQRQKLQEDPALISSAVEELLRYNGPMYTATNRWACEDIEWGGKVIKSGDLVLVGLSSANHDERHFCKAEELDITRQENKHLAFGKGIHYCLGAPLARLEGQIAIGTLLARMPHLRLNIAPQDLKWRPGTLVHALDRLPVVF